jgi:uncharacterized protein
MENRKSLIDAVKSRDLLSSQKFITSGADVNSADDQEWTPLSYAAGNGDLNLVQLLVENGADIFRVSRDHRTPYLIALAAGKVEVAKYLREIEERVDPEKARSIRPERKYCKAYYLKELSEFHAWPESGTNSKGQKQEADGDKLANELEGDRIVYLHQDFSVTESMWHNEGVIFQQVTEEWEDFCSRKLGFKVPDDLDLMPPQMTAN